VRPPYASPVGALRSTRVLLPDGVGPATVVLDGPRIAAIEAHDHASDDVLDVGDHLIVHSWVNAHTHLPMSSLRSIGGTAAREGNVVEELWFAIEACLTPDDIRAFTRLGALECLLNGTGAVFEHYYAGEAVVQALLDVGLTGVVAPTLQDLSGPGAKGWEQALDATVRLHGDASLAEQGIAMALGPHATDTVSDTLWGRVLEAPDELPVHVHVAQSPEEFARAAALGCTPVERLRRAGALERRLLAVHALYVSDADRALLDPERHLLGHCPWSQTQFAFPAPVARWRADGFGVVVGTDAGACNDSMNVQQELRPLASGALYAVTERAPARGTGPLDAAGLTADRKQAWAAHEALTDARWLLDTITTTPGGFHPRLPMGRIAAGAWANLAVYDLSHPALWPAADPLRALAYGDALAALHTVVVSGRRMGAVGRPSALLSEPEVRGWIREADERLASLLRRVGA
jgi:5-methylthioadenosine/S-adenosylhomocysteine deaminase